MPQEMTDEERDQVREREQKQANLLTEQTGEITGDVNRYYTIEALRRQGITDREPTREELAFHYITKGGALNFRQRHP